MTREGSTWQISRWPYLFTLFCKTVGQAVTDQLLETFILVKYKDKAGNILRSVSLMSFYWYALQFWRVRRNNQITAAAIKLRSLSLHLSAVYLELLCSQTSVLKADMIFPPSYVQLSLWLKRGLTIKSVFKDQMLYLQRWRIAKCLACSSCR